ncbi:hypothetical protein [Oceanicella actignis]|uniref:Uncharacterized protein n=1 Tax=Oceanicella actignis TaxID=1189325 RepID=A0A1M7TZU6_9RHOB|nr:hypothetical protein [Oceanicella actignis]TYO85038.1 hypothetical protein LY05_02752 [Oceanicella actignis]SET83750.1 hypothetical protein SAMN04488119_11136 [Oceanicella actignis]SHN76276.1 hypothetical protein SAMN05216200_11235 [Oceanicella actignis]
MTLAALGAAALDALLAACVLSTAASIIVAATPTPRDDGPAGRLYRWLEVLAFNFGHAGAPPPNRVGGRFRPD